MMHMEHTTIREITEQPAALEAIRSELRERESALAEAISPSSTICVTGCGTSYYLSLSGSNLLDQVATSVAIPGSETLLSPETLPNNVDVIIPVSRSGESTETVRATESLQEQYPDATIIGVTCTEGSAIYDLADIPILSPEGEEESVVMTKSFSSMLLVFEYISQLIDSDDTDVSEQFDSLSSDSTTAINESDDVVRELGKRTDFEKFFFLGTGEYFGLASEAMLKLEEMTLSWTKAYHPLEFRHGPQSIADEDTLVTVFLPNHSLDLHADLIDDITQLGATTLVIGTQDAIDEVDADFSVVVPNRDTGSLPLYAPAFQLLGYYRAVALDLNPDQPQNLTQVVTL